MLVFVVSPVLTVESVLLALHLGVTVGRIPFKKKTIEMWGVWRTKRADFLLWRLCMALKLLRSLWIVTDAGVCS